MAKQRSNGNRPKQQPATTFAGTHDVTSARSWKRSGAVHGRAVPLPSGNTALVRQIGPEAFVASGLIPDPLAPIVNETIRSKKGIRPEKVADLLTNKETLGAMVEMIDRVTVYAVIEPVVSMPPACQECDELNTTTTPQHSDESRDDYHKFTPSDRDPDILYVDEVDLEDKTFIMNFCLGGTRDLERFRKEQRSTMDSVRDIQGIQVQA